MSHLTSFLLNLDVFLCNSQNQQEISSSFDEPNYGSQVMFAGIVSCFRRKKLDFKQDVQDITIFPIVFRIKPRNYDLKIKTSVQTDNSGLGSSLIPGPLALKKKKKNCY